MNGLSLLVALGIGIATIYLMFRQVRIMDRQLDIMRQQAALLSRRAELSLTVELLTPTPQDANLCLRFHVKNSGNRSAGNFYWHIYVPTDFSANQNLSSYKGDVRPTDTIQIKGRTFRRFRELADIPAYPTRSVLIGTIPRDNPNCTGIIQIHWKLVAEDGAFPAGENDLGELAASIPA